MTKREERILQAAEDLKGQNSLKEYNEMLDDMFCAYLKSDYPNGSKAYFFVTQLKSLLKASCSEFFDFENLCEIEFSEPTNQFEKQISEYIKQDLKEKRKNQ